MAEFRVFRVKNNCKRAIGGAIARVVFVAKKRIDKVKTNNFYIAEDVFINVNRKKIWNRFMGKGEMCSIKFSRNGKYDVYIFEKKEPDVPSCDYSAVNYSKAGDKFYLLMLPDKQKNVILKCFNARYYEIVEDDFDYADGKYYPKKI